ncbi:BQ2448_7701 [Microbotryum intermedium]|uniref:BQ2448_7701 protein n=1 Tax=Microbotryum intermedium TaxID=269621 RepID=A0A238FLM1_9BASI|nr:BQ2448_7701 [Microbotryum intermedium]
MASSRSNEELSDLLVKPTRASKRADNMDNKTPRFVAHGVLEQAALNDPAIAVPGFEASRVESTCCLLADASVGHSAHRLTVLLSSPSSPKKKLVAQMKTVYQFKIENADGVKAVWVVDMKKRGRVQVVPQSEKPSAKPDVTIEMNDRDCVGLATGTVSLDQHLYEAQAFGTHSNCLPRTRIKVRGNLDRALLVEKIITHERQKIESYADPRKRSSDTGRWTGVGKAKL